MKLTLSPDLKQRFANYGRKHGAWGSLHVVLDDFNLEDKHVQGCIEWAAEQGDLEGQVLAELLLELSKTQRARIAKEARKW